MTSAAPLIIHNAEDYYQVCQKFRHIPKRTRSKMKRSVKRVVIAGALALDSSIQIARLLHRKTWHFNASRRLAANKK